MFKCYDIMCSQSLLLHIGQGLALSDATSCLSDATSCSNSITRACSSCNCSRSKSANAPLIPSQLPDKPVADNPGACVDAN